MKKTSGKITNTIKKPKSQSKKRVVQDRPEELSTSRGWHEFYSYESNELFPSRDSFRQRVAYTILTWSESEDALDLGQFFMIYKIPRQTFRDWCLKYPEINQAYQDAKLNIATKRRMGALKRTYDKDVAYKDMHVLDSDYLEINQYHAMLKKDEDKQPHVFNVILDKPEITTKEELDMITSRIGKE